MSAWVVSKAHINAMVHAGLSVRYRPLTWYPKDKSGPKCLTYENASEIGQMLLRECIASVSYRYKDNELTNLPGVSDAEWMIPFQYKRMVNSPTLVEALKNISCYEYQSCEHPEWENSEAHCFCQALRHNTIDQLPGYDEAPWGWEDKEPVAIVGD